ncbi:MAG: riboflavin synthase [Candidatus Melainabacteria bacterium]|nr:riboflavin synthase [Candidatus Melainabacteria bacterium]MBI3307741.1 riboflavin synthase [Candidatus Melainabacteria bacterium]
MFSGIVKTTGKVKELLEKDGILEIAITSNDLLNELKIGDSVAIDGCCQTVVEVTGDSFKVQAVNETLNKTNFRSYMKDTVVNLEPSLKVNDKLDGHLVSGHVDSVGEVVNIQNKGENYVVTVNHPPSLSSFIAPKGSIAVNGISLTVVDSAGDSFSFSLIPYTKENTNLKDVHVGMKVNLEVDLVSRYLVNYLEKSKQLVAK